MNIHHLELFYYVAKHGGVSAAARHIPYGIQQPAISSQIIQLEDSLGVALFQRRPFELTAEGRELQAFIEPFFSGLPALSDKLRGGKEVRLRIGAPSSIQANYLPSILKKMRKRFTQLEFSMVTGWQGEFEELLLAGEIDVAVSNVFGKAPPGIKRQEVLALPMALLVRDQSRWKNAEQILKQDRMEEPLICVDAVDALCRGFQEELERRKITWVPSLELGTLDLVACYVAQGFGIGLVVDQPNHTPPPGTRRLRLEGFPPSCYAAMWLGKRSSLVDTFLEESAHVLAELRKALG